MEMKYVEHKLELEEIKRINVNFDLAQTPHY